MKSFSAFANTLKNTTAKLNFNKAILAAAIMLGAMNAEAQVTQLEHSASSYAGSIPSGPTVNAVKARFVNNTSGNNFSTFNPEINVTASFSDQQYNNAGGFSGLKGNFFGGTSNDDRKEVISQTVWRILNSISNPSDALFTSNPTGTTGQGIDVDVNYGFNMFTTVEPLVGKSTNGRYYYSKLTLTFNRAVSNPVLHIVGLGAWTKVNSEQLGYATELELENGNGINLTKLSGSSALTVANNKITNNKSTINAESSTGAATGSIRVTGNNITTLVFKIYLRGDGKASNWTSSKMFSGDQWLIAFSMNASSISGNVFNDANGLTDSKVNGNPTNLEGKLKVNLVSGNTVVATADVAEDGGYIFQDIVAPSYPANYKLVLSTDATATTSSLPSGWVSTGENVGDPSTNGNDENVDGILTNVTLNSSTTSITNANFGIDKIPSADLVSKTITAPTQNSLLALDGKGQAPALSGADYEDGVLGGAGSKVVITSLPVNGKLFYGADGSEIEITSLNTVISNSFNPSYLKVKFSTPGSSFVSFNYAFVDAAGKQGTPALYELKWGSALPVKLAKFTAAKVEQTAVLTWSTTEEINSDVFEVEHSVNGKDWSTIGSVKATGESATMIDYTYTDMQPATGDNLYRLKMIDLDGTFAYSRINSVKFAGNTEIVAYPNPAADFIKVKVDGQDNWSAVKDVKIFNLNGNVVLAGTPSANEINVTNLASGFYVLQVTRTNGIVSTSKVSIRR